MIRVKLHDQALPERSQGALRFFIGSNGDGLQPAGRTRHGPARALPEETEKGTVEQLERVIGMLAERAQGLDGRADLVERGAELLERVREVGARREPLILITAEK